MCSIGNAQCTHAYWIECVYIDVITCVSGIRCPFAQKLSRAWYAQRCSSMGHHAAWPIHCCCRLCVGCAYCACYIFVVSLTRVCVCLLFSPTEAEQCLNYKCWECSYHKACYPPYSKSSWVYPTRVFWVTRCICCMLGISGCGRVSTDSTSWRWHKWIRIWHNSDYSNHGHCKDWCSHWSAPYLCVWNHTGF